jgi:DNA-binding NarL/FixJ family response regulator
MKILIVEDHALMLDALGHLVTQLAPNVTVLEAADAATTFAEVDRTPDIDLLILDLLLPGQDANDPFQTLKALRAAHAEIPVVVYSGLVNKQTVQRAIDIGAMGFIPKDKSTNKSKIVAALKIVLDGMIYLPSEIFHGPTALASPPSPPDGVDPLDAFKLTPRDREILALVVQGKNDKAVARICGIGVQNVKNRLSELRVKFNVANRGELIFKLWRMQVRLDHIYRPPENKTKNENGHKK